MMTQLFKNSIELVDSLLFRNILKQIYYRLRNPSIILFLSNKVYSVLEYRYSFILDIGQQQKKSFLAARTRGRDFLVFQTGFGDTHTDVWEAIFVHLGKQKKKKAQKSIFSNMVVGRIIFRVADRSQATAELFSGLN